MFFVSTERDAPRVDFRTALFQGLAPDGGLYMPESLVPFSSSQIAALYGESLQHTASIVGRNLVGEQVGLEAAAWAFQDALDFPIPLVPLDDGLSVLELFHGPTAAFKDVAARVMARLMSLLHDQTDGVLTVLTATSGDTGGAVAHAFHGVMGTRVVVLYPRGRISPLQERQFATLGGNILAVAVNGTFDDCQKLAKHALADGDLREAHKLTSANSINIGRLLPQVVYYAHAWAQLPKDAESALVAVPSGNFGNLTAGLLAKRLGIPLQRFVAATNVNDVVPQYLRSGSYSPRQAAFTISSAMDVGNPSNFARMLALYDGSHEAISRDVVGRSCTDEETKDGIQDVFERTGYVLDPHTAVGYLSLKRELALCPESAGLLLATAHPGKFREVVEPVIGQSIPLPPSLETCMAQQPKSLAIDPSLVALRGVLEVGETL